MGYLTKSFTSSSRSQVDSNVKKYSSYHLQIKLIPYQKVLPRILILNHKMLINLNKMDIYTLASKNLYCLEKNIRKINKNFKNKTTYF